MWNCPPPPVRRLYCGSWKTCASIWKVTVCSARSLSAPSTITCAFTTGPNQVGKTRGSGKIKSINPYMERGYRIYISIVFSWSRTTVSQWKWDVQWQFHKGSCWRRHSHYVRLQSSKEGAAILSWADTHAATSATRQLQSHWTRARVCT